MKKLLFGLPLCFLLSYCSTTKSDDATVYSGSTTETSEPSATATVNATTTVTDAPESEVSMKTTASTSTNPSLKITNYSIGYDYNSNYTVNNPWVPYVTVYEVEPRVDNSPLYGSWNLSFTPEVAANWRLDTASFDNYYAGVRSTPAWLTTTYHYGSETVTPETTIGVRDSKTSSTTANARKADPKKSILGSEKVVNKTSAPTSDKPDILNSNKNILTGHVEENLNEEYGHSQLQYVNREGETVTWNNQFFVAANGNLYQMPRLNLFIENGSFTGFTGCNGIRGKIVSDGSSLHFDDISTTTGFDCKGGVDEQAFIDMLKSVNSYETDGNDVILKSGDKMVLRFSKKADDTTHSNNTDSMQNW